MTNGSDAGDGCFERKTAKAPKRFDWTDDRFLKDDTYYTGLDRGHFWAGVGLLMNRVQDVKYSLDLDQLVLIETSDGDIPAYDLGEMDTVPKARSLEGTALWRIFSDYYGGWRHGTDNEVARMCLLIREKHYFADGFFAQPVYGDDSLNEDLMRLKSAVLIAGEMSERYYSDATGRRAKKG